MFLRTVILLLLLFLSDNCIFSNINIEPQRVLLKINSEAKLLCTKEKDDNRSFEINLSPNTSSESIQISTNLLNNTAMEIIIQSFNQIGRFYLLCLSGKENDHGPYSELIIGKPPGVFHRSESCIVYYDKYIDCKIYAPIMIQASQNRLNYNFNFKERRLPSQGLIYRKNPKLIKIDKIKQTFTFRWFPQESGNFPSDFKMIVYATIIDFGTGEHTMDMTPIFRISSNFTVSVLSSTDLEIEFPNENLVCNGNLTRVDRNNNSHEREDIRTFGESDQKLIRVTSLRSNTWYRLCFYCHRDESVQTISDVVCDNYKTMKSPIKPFPIVIFIISFCGVILIIIIIWFLIRRNRNRTTRTPRSRHSQESNNGETIEFDTLTSRPNQRIPQST